MMCNHRHVQLFLLAVTLMTIVTTLAACNGGHQ
jgi:hypothetical protein